jgi:hypothetical protein
LYKQGKSSKNLDSLSKRDNKDIAKMKIARMDAKDLEESQARVDDMKVATICARG